ncbi:hypothetical protein Ancab_018440 [Ancistrocladus abbreviatus]
MDQNMSIPTRRLLSPLLLVIILAIFASTNGSSVSRKLDEASAPGDVRCGSCAQNPPPLPPPPPPPSGPLCPPPPRKKKPPCTSSCVPSPNIVYILGPPGNLYPVDANFSSAWRSGFPAGLLFLIDGDCPYPCFPPPTGGGATTPAPPTTQTGTYPPPLDYSPPTTGDIPNYPPPSGSAGFGKPPPPPDPILPYFPYYYKKGLHPSDQSSAAAPLHGLMFKIFGSGLIACLIFFSLLLF